MKHTRIHYFVLFDVNSEMCIFITSLTNNLTHCQVKNNNNNKKKKTNKTKQKKQQKKQKQKKKKQTKKQKKKTHKKNKKQTKQKQKKKQTKKQQQKNNDNNFFNENIRGQKWSCVAHLITRHVSSQLVLRLKRGSLVQIVRTAAIRESLDF